MKKGKIKGAVVVALASITAAAATLGLAACNNTETTQPNPDVPPTPTEKTFTISQIYDNNAAALDFDAKQAMDESVDALADKALGDGSDVLDVVSIDENNLGIIATQDDMLQSFTVEIAPELQEYFVEQDIDVKERIIESAGYTASQVKKESEQKDVVSNLERAKQAIQADIKALAQANPENKNTYDEVIESEGGIFLGRIFDGNKMFVWKIQGDQIKRQEIEFYKFDTVPDEERKNYYLNQKYMYVSEKTISLTEKYEYVEPTPDPPEIIVGFEDIFNQVFGEDYIVPSCQSAIENILEIARPENIAKDKKLICADISSENLTFYIEAVNNLGRTVFSEVQYVGSNEKNITEYLNILKDVDKAGSFMSYAQAQVGFVGDVEEGSSEYDNIVAQLNQLKNSLTSGKQSVDALQSKDFGSTGLINQTRETLPAPANQFGEAILEDQGINGNIIATYVGDTSIGFDQTGHFETGYLGGFKMAVVYENNGIVKIIKTEVLVPSQINSPSEDLYNELIAEEGQHELRNTEQINIENPVYQSSKQSAFEISR